MKRVGKIKSLWSIYYLSALKQPVMRYFFLLVLLLPFTFSAALTFRPMPHGCSKRIMLANPTVNNLKIMETLHITGMLNLSDVELVGIYHRHEASDYPKSISHAASQNLLHISLYALTDTLEASKLFSTNECSDEFQYIVSNTSGAFFFGGPDIPSEIYNELPHPRTVVTDPFRHYVEASFLFHLLGGIQNPSHKAFLETKPEYFITGFCLGMQTMNVATGGTLIQDIPSEIYGMDETAGLQALEQNQVHRNYYAQLKDQCYDVQGSSIHQIKFTKRFQRHLFNPLSVHPNVNSYHHQSIEKLGKGLKAVAHSMDGKIIEAVYHTRYKNVFAVQFHPERTDLYQSKNNFRFSPEDVERPLPVWIGEDGMTFHRAYWSYVNSIIQKL
jgi:putative glutamine amidotransferase